MGFPTALRSIDVGAIQVVLGLGDGAGGREGGGVWGGGGNELELRHGWLEI